MYKKIEINRKKIFDGKEEDFLKLSFEINNENFKISDFYNNPLRDIEKIINKTDFDLIIKEGKFKLKNSFIKTYLSQEGLEVYYLIKNDNIYLFSFGEFQPTRYMLFFEMLETTKLEDPKPDKPRGGWSVFD
ncbi:hypothetical protein B0A58_00245 [Flavobacterium branchiophilum NBRC 15030 = ATCC 35035]|uniref:Uncharacterized protein n=1 Tax=Flavobacterium branchiophilum TaxID=55197 RepID=A0A543G6V9_9FLAO|nr:hypothetical protein [Flavobacterium branchiophilum]OXA82340.1 hypothetical protein B0A58_00245 [Flavobacterium branchiophilum NBRC 15030 = ATCC 35035]TQM41812.1 hypothetical protein BC670_2822 [Flavobacterium branchiophilum]GEM56357.1 hypothetical protein FB1_25780 [Flavobacterium branchiophilum NBRC 15030 = ATCC 35035]